MSVIKNDRKARASKFVSIRNLLEELAETEGISVNEIAGELIYWDKRPGENLPFYKQDPATLILEEHDQVFKRTLLNRVSELGFDWPDRCYPTLSDLDEHGWGREEMGTFSLVFFSGIPACCEPDWEPSVEEINGGSGSVTENKKGQDDGLQAVQNGPQAQCATSNDFYTTPLLDLQKAAILEFYSQQRVVDPKKEEVTKWLSSEAKKLELGLSDNVAEAMFTIIKPKDHNPKKRRG